MFTVLIPKEEIKESINIQSNNTNSVKKNVDIHDILRESERLDKEIADMLDIYPHLVNKPNALKDLLIDAGFNITLTEVENRLFKYTGFCV